LAGPRRSLPDVRSESGPLDEFDALVADEAVEELAAGRTSLRRDASAAAAAALPLPEPGPGVAEAAGVLDLEGRLG